MLSTGGRLQSRCCWSWLKLLGNKVGLVNLRPSITDICNCLATPTDKRQSWLLCSPMLGQQAIGRVTEHGRA